MKRLIKQIPTDYSAEFKHKEDESHRVPLCTLLVFAIK